jgi:folate-binding protein YgfZ
MEAPWLNVPADQQNLTHLLALDTITPLPEVGLLACEGPDSARFLQGQLTCNVQEVSAAQAQPGAHCTPKGRMVANFLLAQTTEHSYCMRTERGTLPALTSALAKYIVFSKAKLRDSSADFIVLGLQGPTIGTLLTPLCGSLPESAGAIIQTTSGYLLRCRGVEPRYEYWVHTTMMDSLWPQLSGLQLTSPGFWQWLDIRDGLVSVHADFVEAFIPQMLNLHQTDAISFTKGCYTGQEIVARAQYRGAVKKQMIRLTGHGTAPAPGEKILVSGTPDHACGEMVMAQSVDADTWEGLAVVQQDALEETLQTANALPIVRLPLPYEAERA